VAPPAPALPPAPVILAPPPAVSPHPGPYRTQRRSLADMANEQLRREKKGPLEQGMEAAGRDDCLHAPKEQGTLGGVLAAPQLIERALTGKCAR
jgi:hypothetical protein